MDNKQVEGAEREFFMVVWSLLLAATSGLLAAASSKAETAGHNYVNLGIRYSPAGLCQVDGMQGLGNIPRKNVRGARYSGREC
jgi:hypothetical protein